jgi:hypothetical protein
VARLAALGALAIGGVVAVAMLGFLVVAFLMSLVVPAALVAVTVLVVRHGAHRRAHVLHHPAPPAVAPAPNLSWESARTRFAAVRAAYAAHECDPMAVLRLPALSDVSVPSTGRFVEAFAEAQALDTDARPPQAQAAAFVAAVERAERAWRAAVDAAERIRLSGLAPAERATVERVVKLLTTARDSDSDAERLAAYSRARSELAKLDRAGVVHLPRPARAALDAAARGELPG